MKRLLPLLLCILFFAGCAASAPSPPAVEAGAPGTLAITFDFERQSGVASNQFAVWIEDLDGNMVKTLYATQFTATKGYKNRPDSLATWVNRALGSTDFDAVAGATPKSGPQVYVLDCADIAPGSYRFFVEGTLRWKDNVLYTGEIEIGGAYAFAEAIPEFDCEDDAPERGMITYVRGEYLAIGE